MRGVGGAWRLAGIGLWPRRWYGRARRGVRRRPAPRRFPAVLRAPSLNKYFVDEIYDAAVIRPLVAACRRPLVVGPVDRGRPAGQRGAPPHRGRSRTPPASFDKYVVDGVGVNGTAPPSSGSPGRPRAIQTGQFSALRPGAHGRRSWRWSVCYIVCADELRRRACSTRSNTFRSSRDRLPAAGGGARGPLLPEGADRGASSTSPPASSSSTSS